MKSIGMEAVVVVKRSLCLESEDISLNLILMFNSWGSLSKLLYFFGLQFAKLLK